MNQSTVTFIDDAFIDVANVKLSPEQFKKIGKAMKKVQLTVQPGTAQYTKVIEADTSGTVLNVVLTSALCTMIQWQTLTCLKWLLRVACTGVGAQRTSNWRCGVRER